VVVVVVTLIFWQELQQFTWTFHCLLQRQNFTN